VQVCFLVAVKADHAFLIVDVRGAAILAREFRVDPASVAQGTRFSLVPLHEGVPLDEACIDPGDYRPLDVTIAARGVTTSTGFLEHLVLKDLELRRGESGGHTMRLARCRVVQSLFVRFCDIPMAGAADSQVIGRSRRQPLVGPFSCQRFFVALVAGGTTLNEMGVLGQDILVNKKGLVHLVRLNWRRCPCSAFPFATFYLDGLMEGFEHALVCVARDATACLGP
jgi:hypothetical protein